MSDLGVLVPILAPSGFGTRQSASFNTVENGERVGLSASSSDTTTDIEQSAAPNPAAVDPLTGLALGGLSAGLVATLQEADDQTGQPGGDDSAGDNSGTQEAEENGEDGDAPDRPEGSGTAGPTNLTPEEQQVVQELERTDAEIRRHEQAHAAAGGPYAGAPSYDYTRGPDGRLYAIGGDVQIDVAVVPGNPQATIQKMQTVRRAALAPATPSPQDQRVAAIAQQRIIEARREQADLELEERQAAAEKREEAQERAQGLQPAAASSLSGGEAAEPNTAATIPALTVGASTVSGPVTTTGELLNVIA